MTELYLRWWLSVCAYGMMARPFCKEDLSVALQIAICAALVVGVWRWWVGEGE